MFWKFDLHTASQVEKLLEKEDVTLKELLDEEDILQECKAQNQRLLVFLTQDSSLLELVNLITHEPPTDREEKLRYKYANTACELLTCDVSTINDKVGGDDTLLNTLYSFLEQEPPVNALLASFFSKTFGSLISRKTEQTISFLRNKEGFISLVLKHMDTSAMMDLLLQLISCVEPAALRQEVLTWLDEERLIQRLTQLIHPNTDNERQSNASQALCDIVRTSRDQVTLMQLTLEPDPLLSTLERQESVEALLKNMFEGERSEVRIVNGTQVLLALLETRKSGAEQMDAGSQGMEKFYTVNNSILLGIQSYLKHFHHLLLNPPKKCSILTTMGVLEEPFGNARLHTCRLTAALLNTSAPRIHHDLCRLDMINLLLDLFFKFTWNNFLHVQVEQCVFAILQPIAPEGTTQHSPVQTPSENTHPGTAHTQTEDTTNLDQFNLLSHQDLVTHLFVNCRLVQRILDAWEENDKTQAEGGMRRGYMGHLTRIANAVVQSVEKGPAQAHISQLINELPEDYRSRWHKFVEETLAETNKKNAVDMVLSDYQIQQMTANFVDQFGFNDDEFGEHDDSINATFNRLAGIKCNLVDEGPSLAVFATCKEKTRHFDDADEEEEDIWEDKEINYAMQVKSRTRFGVTSNTIKNQMERGALRHLGSPDLEQFPKQIQDSDQRKDTDTQCCLPTSPGWVASFEDDFNFKADFASVAIDTGSDVWGGSSVPLNDSEEKGWATFADFQPFCCSDSGPRCSSPVDSENQGKDKNQEKNLKGSSACVWSVCGARKAPLVASDSSSSGSESEEEEERSEIIMETLTTANGKQSGKPTTDAANENALFNSEASSSMAGGSALMPITDSPVPKEQKTE